MLFNTAGSGINKSQTQTIKKIKVVYHVPTPFSSVVCHKENLLLNGIQFWLNYQRHFPYENHSLTCVINSSLAILIYFYHREIGAELKGNSTLHFRLLFKALLPLHLQLLSTEQRLSSRFFCTAKLDLKKKKKIPTGVKWTPASLSNPAEISILQGSSSPHG